MEAGGQLHALAALLLGSRASLIVLLKRNIITPAGNQTPAVQLIVSHIADDGMCAG
jgi:hypothetical protein